jgi:hypothetical protein
MGPAAALARGRAAALALMVDACTIGRPGELVTDPDTGVQTAAGSVPVYAGRCRVQQQQRGAQAQRSDLGGALLAVLRLEVHVPTSVLGVAEGDDLVVTASAHDPDLVGRRFRVRDLSHKSFATARRLGCEEVT